MTNPKSPVAEPAGVVLRRLAPTIYLPATLFEVGIGAFLPLVAVAASGMGANLTVAGLVAALALVGQVVGDVPAGAVAARLGERRALMLASTLACATLVAAAFVTQLWIFAALVFLTGIANSVVMLARQAFLTEYAPAELRARALSTLGGLQRVGSFMGPFLAAGLMVVFPFNSVFLGGAACALGTAALVFFAPELPPPPATSAASQPTTGPVSLAQVFRDNRVNLRRISIVLLMVGAVRGARQVVVPLWCLHLGIDATTTSVIVGVSGAVDMLLFYPSGKLMDARGRLWIAVPSMLVLGGAIMVLPLTNSVAALTAVAMLMGFGNGIGSGILMTLSADSAPAVGRAQYLGACRLFADTGNAAGPLLLSGFAALTFTVPVLPPLGLGMVVTGLLGVSSIGPMLRCVPMLSAHANRHTRRAAGLTSRGSST